MFLETVRTGWQNKFESVEVRRDQRSPLQKKRHTGECG